MTEIDILGEIGEWGYPANYLRYQLADAGSGDVTINISSPGGQVTEGLAMYDMLEAHPGNVTTVGFGLVASISSVILLAGKTVKMTPNSFFMIHNPWSVTIGDSAETAASAELLAKMEKKLQGIYIKKLEKSGKTDGNIALRVKRMMDAETWLTAQEALDMGFIDEIQEVKKEANIIQMQPALARYINTPAALLINNNDDMNAKEILKQVRAMLSGADDNEPEQAVPTTDAAASEPEPEVSVPEMTAEAAIEFLQKTGYKILTAEEVAAEAAKAAEAKETSDQMLETMQALAAELQTVKAQVKQAIAAPSGASNNPTAKPINDKPQASKFDALAAIWNQKMAR